MVGLDYKKKETLGRALPLLVFANKQDLPEALSLPIGIGTGVDCLLNIGIFIDKLGGSIDELLMS